MVGYITSGASVITPSAIVGYESARSGRSIVHEIIDRPSPDYTLRPAGLRTGRMRLAFTASTSEADSLAAENVLAAGAICNLVAPDRATVQVTFVVPEGGAINRSLSDATGASWMVEFDWREVAP